MASFFSKLFGGGGGSDDGGPKRSDPVEHGGYKIVASPAREGEQWRLGGFVMHEADGVQMEREFIRADLFTSREEAEDFSIRKGKQIVDEQGKRLFADGAETGRA